ncbi:MAG: DUF885 family protein, partial [Pseudomonadota bacterium]|nr:DUF885 family protein [Pseudomonadota bacterium]
MFISCLASFVTRLRVARPMVVRPMSLFRAALVCVMATAAGAASAAAATRGLEARLAAENALFEEQYQAELKAHPQRATAYGDYRYNGLLDEHSLAALAAENAGNQRFLARLVAISTEGFPEQDETSHEVMRRALQQRIDDYGYKEYEMPVSQMSGPHVSLADLPLAVPLDSVAHYQDYLARLRQIPRVFSQTEELLRAGMHDHLMPVRFLLEKVPTQCDGVIAADPFLLPIKNFPEGISAGDRERLSREIKDVVEAQVLPAYRAFGQFIAAEYAPRGRAELAVASLPGGSGRYANDIRSRTTVSALNP